MTMISKAAVGIAVSIAGIFMGYCFYFDQKRRSDPEFKKKLRERRKTKKQAQKAKSKIPDLTDQKAVQNFFMQQIQLGEEMLACGEIEAGIEHFSKAIAVCGQPSNLLQVLEQTLPPQVFYHLLQQLPNATQKLSQSAMAEEDVE